MNTSRPLLAAVMIVKNEEQHLAHCLESIRPVCDEIIVVDTGSTDGTVAIAEQFGARIFHRIWRNDFAAARNESLSHTNAEWVLYIDADEVLTNANQFPLREVLTRSHDVAAFGVQLSPMIGWLPYTDFRIWRHDPQIQFVGEIHESTLSDIRTLADERNQRLEPIPLHIQHLGYEQDQTKKNLRNLPLLLQQLDTTPRKINIIGQIGRIHQSLGNLNDAEYFLRMAVDVIREDGEKEIFDVIAMVSLAQFLMSRGEDVHDLLEEAERLRPEYLVTQLIYAQNHLIQGRYEEALKHTSVLTTARESNPANARFAYNTQIFTMWPQQIVAECHFALQNYSDAWLAFGNLVVMGVPYVRIREKLRACEQHMQGSAQPKHPYAGSLIDLSDVTFLIPLRIDSGERLRNVIATTTWLVNTFNTNVVVGIADVQSVRPLLDPRVHVFDIDDNPDLPFHVTRAFNELSRHVKTPIFVHHDTDVIIPADQLLEAVTRIRTDNADIAIPYDMWITVPSEEISDLLATPDLTRARVGYPRSTGNPVGGCVIRTMSNFFEMGMDNEHFIGWSPEDQERIDRAQKLGARITHCDGPLFHLDHPRRVGQPQHDPYWQISQAEYMRLKALSVDDLREEMTLWPWQLPNTVRTPQIVEASDLTITIPVRIDSSDRLRNLITCTNFLAQQTNARVLVGISDPAQIRDLVHPRIEIMQVFDPPQMLFHRTRVLNELARSSTTDFIANLDCDVIIPLEQLEHSLEVLRKEQVELIYPYDGVMIGVPFGYHPWLERADFASLPTTLQHVMHPHSLGGCMFWNRQAFLDIGMENENLISWGFDDDERHARAQILGLRVRRINGCIYHLDHSRGVDSSPSNPLVNGNQQEFERISQMTSDELSREISRWAWVESNQTSKTNILIWNDPWHSMSYFSCDSDFEYVISRSRDDLAHADVIFLPLPTCNTRDVSELRDKLRAEQQIVGFCRESLGSYPFVREASSCCDALMTYELDSDIPVPYILDHDFSNLPRISPLSSRHNTLVTAWISSTEETSGRTQFLNDLMNHITVDSYGRVANNQSLNEDCGSSSKLTTIANYRFTLALENTISHDYVTEKFFEPLLVGSVPIYLGAPNVDSFAPGDHCFINVNDFTSVAELADYISTMSDDEYMSFHEWRTLPLRPSFVEKQNLYSESPFTQLAHWYRQQSDAGRAPVAMTVHQ